MTPISPLQTAILVKQWMIDYQSDGRKSSIFLPGTFLMQWTRASLLTYISGLMSQWNAPFREQGLFFHTQWTWQQQMIFKHKSLLLLSWTFVKHLAVAIKVFFETVPYSIDLSIGKQHVQECSWFTNSFIALWLDVFMSGAPKPLIVNMMHKRRHCWN